MLHTAMVKYLLKYKKIYQANNNVETIIHKKCSYV